MHRSLVPALVLLATACEPRNATLVAGDYTAWLAATNSVTVAKGDALFDADGDVLVADEPGPGAYDGSKHGYASATAIDCREFSSVRKRDWETLRLPGRQPLCEGDRDQPKNFDWPPDHETWLDQNGFYVLNDQLEPWRGEAIVTSEGDVQIGFHHRLPGGQDFRFAIVVDPDFEPRRCVDDADGEGTHWEAIDGDWVTQWSKGLPDGSRRYFLNSGAYQFDPDQEPTEPERDRWFLPLEWRAGYAAGKFGDDKFQVRSTRYAEPSAYVRADSAGVDTVTIPRSALFYCDLVAGQDAATSPCIQSMVDRVEGIADDVERELHIAGIPQVDDLPSPRPVVHDNVWRTVDGRPAGFDGWVELNYSWITFAPGSDLAEGGSLEGEFNVFFDAVDSQSRFHVRGSFQVDALKKDIWVTDYLPDIKLEENGTILCGGD